MFIFVFCSPFNLGMYIINKLLAEAEAVEKFALNYSKRHQSGLKPSERIVSPKMGEVVALNPV